MYRFHYGQDPGAALPPEWAEPVYGMPTQTGMEGIYKAWQRFLARQGYSLGSYCADGDWGSKTKAATREFQKDQGLTVSPEGYMLRGTEIRANKMGLGTASMVKPLTTAEKRIACPAARPTTSHVATTSYTPPADGAAGAGISFKEALTPRNIAIGVSGLVLVVGVITLIRGNRQPALGTAAYGRGWDW